MMRRAASLLLVVVTACLFALRARQVAVHGIGDFDTEAILNAIRQGPGGSVTLLGVAHPGLLSVFSWLLQKALWLGCPLDLLWSGLLIAALACTCALIGKIGAELELPAWRARLCMLAFLASPAIGDICMRAEENLLTQALFASNFWLLVRGLKRPGRAAYLMLALNSALLAAQHLQAAVVFSAGLMLYAIASARRQSWATWRAETGLVSAMVCLPQAVYYAALWLLAGDAFEAQREGYVASFHSLLNNDGLAAYVASHLMFLKGYVLTGRFDFAWVDGQTHPREAIQWGGLLLLVTLIYVVRRARLTDMLCVSGLVFPLLYEPSSSERWDTFVLPLVLRLWLDSANRGALALGSGILLMNLRFVLQTWL